MTRKVALHSVPADDMRSAIAENWACDSNDGGVRPYTLQDSESVGVDHCEACNNSIELPKYCARSCRSLVRSADQCRTVSPRFTSEFL